MNRKLLLSALTVLLLSSLIPAASYAATQDASVMQILLPIPGTPITALTEYQGQQLLILKLKLPQGADECLASVTSQQNPNAPQTFSFTCPSTGNVALPILTVCASTDSCIITVQMRHGEKEYYDYRTYSIRLTPTGQTPAIEILTPPPGSTIKEDNLVTIQERTYILVRARIPGGAPQCTIMVSNYEQIDPWQFPDGQIGTKQYTFSNCQEEKTFAIPVPGLPGDCGNVDASQQCALTLSTATHAIATVFFTVDLVLPERPIIRPPTGPATLTIRDIRLKPSSGGKTRPGQIEGADVVLETGTGWNFPNGLGRNARLSINKDGQEVCFSAPYGSIFRIPGSHAPGTAVTYDNVFTSFVAARTVNEEARPCILTSETYELVFIIGGSNDPYGADNSDSPIEAVVAPVSGAECAPGSPRNGVIEGEAGFYCRDGRLVERKAAGICVQHYECASNLCISGSCIGSGQEVEVNTIAAALCDIGVRVVDYC